MRYFVVIISLLSFAWPAASHVNETQAGKLAYFEDGVFIGGSTSWGIVLPYDGNGGGYARVCEEAYSFPAVIPPSFSVRRTDGSIFLGGYAGAFVSRELGCVYEPVVQLEGLVASAIGIAPSGRYFITTANLGDDNGVLASDDEGETWFEVLAPIAEHSFFQMALDGERIIISGSSNATGPTFPAILVSVDGGASFTDVSAAYAAYPLVRATIFDGDDALFGGFNSQGRGIVLRAAPPFDAPVEQLVETEDGTPSSFPSEISHIAVLPSDGSLFALARLTNALFRQPVGGAFTQVTNLETGPTDCIFVKPGGDGLIGCGKEAADSLGLYVESDDGITWSTLIGFDDVRYRQCDAETAGGIACAAQFESNCDDNIDNDADQEIDCDDFECAEACAGGEGEGEGGEGEGEPAEGEGEGEGEGESGPSDGPPRGTCLGCSGTPLEVVSVVALLAVTRRRRL